MNVYLTGRRRSGKDTAARAIAEAFGLRVVPLTGPIYEIARAYFGMDGKDRELLQRVGDAFRAVDRDWLVRHVMAQGDGLVCADVRLPREAELLRGAGWIGLRVERPEGERAAAIIAAGERVEGLQAQHATETSVESVPVDLVVPNDASRRALGIKSVMAIQSLCCQDHLGASPWSPCAALARAMEREGD